MYFFCRYFTLSSLRAGAKQSYTKRNRLLQALCLRNDGLLNLYIIAINNICSYLIVLELSVKLRNVTFFSIIRLLNSYIFIFMLLF